MYGLNHVVTIHFNKLCVTPMVPRDHLGDHRGRPELARRVPPEHEEAAVVAPDLRLLGLATTILYYTILCYTITITILYYTVLYYNIIYYTITIIHYIIV